ncbi:SgcJ/EcaC family oxidoreductase [Sulfidibacter corallicola]|uniref:SgcJ/EcaC family oxidoreductase n=1 Tax=Sulfidibacter corallicola TaxID=2818388 RepID=A0A8A4TK34_SULCO|nr:SgcJ/EcaC family oxidoreductase [Sulfidibacter corallicola]QTD49502.1 SgcJ/EcaC family oxidoreductase [Sulfidibacter corallicola]
MKMTKTLSCLVAIAVAVMVHAIAHHSKKGDPMKLEEQNVMKAVLGMTAAFHAKDIEGVMASYTPEAIVVFEPGKPTGDAESIREGFQGFFAVNPEFSYAWHQVYVTGDSAVHIAPWRMTGRAPDGTEINQSGLSVAVLRRQPDGKWLLAIDNPYGNTQVPALRH